MGPIIVMTMFTIPRAVFGEAFLSFIGLRYSATIRITWFFVNDGYKINSNLSTYDVLPSDCNQYINFSI